MKKTKKRNSKKDNDSPTQTAATAPQYVPRRTVNQTANDMRSQLWGETIDTIRTIGRPH